ncbi:MAG: PPOX class F420-dependent oxidoreductase [Myxococcota bacterium]|nr:PPOX class F420-dependent oxidoreductase [Myxococcota bacterium]
MSNELRSLGDETYINLATYRKNGREVRTPVWVAPDGDRLVVWTNVNSGKVKRLRNSDRARIAACDARGKLRGDWLDVHARVLEDPAERDRGLEALFRKYSWQMRLARFALSLTGRWAQRAAVEIRVSPS